MNIDISAENRVSRDQTAFPRSFRNRFAARIARYAAAAACLLLALALIGCGRPQDGAPSETEPVTAEPAITPIPEITEGVHASEEGYRAYFTTHAVRLGGLTVHIEDKLFSEDKLFALAETIGADLETVRAKTRAAETPASIYIVEKTLGGEPTVCGGNLFCSAEDVESGAYREALCGVFLGTDIPWKQIGLMNYAFGTADESGLAEFYLNEAHGTAASCAAVFFEPGVADAETVAAAKKTAASITAFVIEKSGFEAFRALESTADILPEWSEHIGLQAPPVLPDGNAEAALMTAERDPRYLAVLRIGSVKLFVENDSFIAAADEIYRFVCFYFSGSKELIAHLKAVIPGTADIAEENLQKPIDIYLIPADSPSNFGNEQGIYLASEDAVWHELVHHILWVSQNDRNVWWEREAVACCLSDPVTTKTLLMSEEEYFSAYIRPWEESGEYTEEHARFFEKRLAVYRYLKERDGLCAEDIHDYHAFMYSLGLCYMLIPNQERYHTTIGESSLIYLRTFIDPNATLTVGPPEEDSNGLTYSEATVLLEYLMDTYGTDTVMDDFMHSRSIQSTFGKSYPELYLECIEYLQETYGELITSLE